ncbi:MAG: hypothetical protein U1D30_06660 [Planctomycetota bacterium]
MADITFKVLSGTDRDYFDALQGMRESGLPFDLANFGVLGERLIDELKNDGEFNEILKLEVRSFDRITFKLESQCHVTINRDSDNPSVFDRVTVNSPATGIVFAKYIAVIQSHFESNKIADLGILFGSAGKVHFEAREAALARLETMTARVVQDMDESRKVREEQFRQKDIELEAKYRDKEAELETKEQNRQAAIKEQWDAIEEQKKELDDRAAKHARRQHYKEIKEKFKSWSESFGVTKGTQGLRRGVSWVTGILAAAFAALAGYFLFQTTSVADNAQFIVVSVKQVTFTALFVSTVYFLIRFNRQWFEQHADEEFRLKRMELDIDRASWFVEMAFEWREEKGEPIPLELIDRLTRGLFANESRRDSVEPADSLVHALLGAAHLKLKLPGGSEAEYNQRDVRKILKESNGQAT